MKYLIIPVTPFQQNCSLVWCETTRKAAVIDPGGNIDRILAQVEKLGLSLEKIVLTHGHIDHVGGANALSKQMALPIIGPHIADASWLENLPKQSQNFGFPHCEPFEPTQYLAHGDVVCVGDVTLQVLHCPGHTPGHIVLFDPKTKIAFVGDVLFRGSIGRTDFPNSNHQDLLHSITSQLWPLGKDVQFVPGHGPISTFGEERASNPFVADQLLQS